MTDPIADMLTRIRNAITARHPRVRVPHSNFKARIAEVLRDEGFVQAVRIQEDGVKRWLDIELRYLADQRPALRGAKRVSRPGLRIHSRAQEIPRVMGGIGVALLSTSEGVMTGQAAVKRRIGGEVLCFVW
jgi:small subunit ribosomal protein S8